MKDISEKLYEFNVVLEVAEAQELYRLTLSFSGDEKFYERLISTAISDSVVLTCRSLPYLMKLLHQEKRVFYLEQQTPKKTKHVQWSLEHILKREKDLLVFNDKKMALDVKNALLFYCNLFAREEALKHKSECPK